MKVESISIIFYQVDDLYVVAKLAPGIKGISTPCNMM